MLPYNSVTRNYAGRYYEDIAAYSSQVLQMTVMQWYTGISWSLVSCVMGPVRSDHTIIKHSWSAGHYNHTQSSYSHRTFHRWSGPSQPGRKNCKNCVTTDSNWRIFHMKWTTQSMGFSLKRCLLNLNILSLSWGLVHGALTDCNYNVIGKQYYSR